MPELEQQVPVSGVREGDTTVFELEDGIQLEVRCDSELQDLVIAPAH
jgi:hypothetical protein